MQTLSRKMVSPIIQLALKEDGAYHDLTSRAIIPPQSRVVARIMARSEGVLAGAPVAAWTFQTFDPSLRCTIQCKEGAVIAPSQTLLTVKGKARSIFSAERSALNLLGHLSGIATQTRRFIQQMSSSSVHLLDTRKTLPGLRILEKYAVRIGGGYNHRMGLSNAILIKTNQIHALRLNRAGRKKAITQAIQMARRHNPKTFIQVEVTDMQEFREALAANPDSILLDNWSVANIRKAVAVRNRLPRIVSRLPQLEASGGITLANIRAIARTGVERISVGLLTRAAPTLDLSLRVVS